MRRLLFALALAGCTQAEAQVDPQIETGDATEDTCGVAEAETLVGQDKSTVAGLKREGAIRVIGPGEAVTMDFSPSRLNVEHDDGGKITRVWCG